MGQANYRFRDSEFHLLFQPSYCPKRVWLLANRSQWADDDSAFQDLLFRRVKAVEKRHLNQLDPTGSLIIRREILKPVPKPLWN